MTLRTRFLLPVVASAAVLALTTPAVAAPTPAAAGRPEQSSTFAGLGVRVQQPTPAAGITAWGGIFSVPTLTCRAGAPSSVTAEVSLADLGGNGALRAGILGTCNRQGQARYQAFTQRGAGALSVFQGRPVNPDEVISIGIDVSRSATGAVQALVRMYDLQFSRGPLNWEERRTIALGRALPDLGRCGVGRAVPEDALAPFGVVFFGINLAIACDGDTTAGKVYPNAPASSRPAGTTYLETTMADSLRGVLAVVQRETVAPYFRVSQPGA